VGGGRTTTINGVSCGGSVQALSPSSGSILWQVCLNAPVLGPVTAVPGLALAASFSFGGGQALNLIDVNRGAVIARYLNSSFYAGASIANGVLYIGDVTGTLYALGPSGGLQNTLLRARRVR
jgi:outer membrane protein assembly factor BamB